ncbi:MAG: OmpA family protein [Alysiella sp.]|uniref:OmpA family protein n=1 Tax=Alysiella sp. TaxID=1872483 RepID=UPI0026DDC5C3|nr:OmpA family protein [Alysiella sp.]MDO4433565.1 OmpA family protein [Alysiella sp.]
MNNNEKIHLATNTVSSETSDNGTRVGLWVGLSAAAIATVGVLALAFYTDYQANKKAKESPSVGVSETTLHIQTSHILPANEQEAASMALVISETQSNGMTAPADEAIQNILPAQTIITPIETTPIADNQADVIVENGVVKFYFALGKSELGGDILAALNDINTGVKAGRKVVVSGYTDNTGDTQTNELLSKERAFKVRDALIAAGIPADQIEMQKPQITTGSGSQSEARRVEVVLQ